MSYGSMHTEFVKRLQDLHERRGDHPTQVLFVEFKILENHAKTPMQLASFPQRSSVVFCWVILHGGWKSPGKQNSTNLRLCDVISLF